MRQGAAQSAPTSFPSTTTRIIMLIIVNRSRLLYYSSCKEVVNIGKEEYSCELIPGCPERADIIETHLQYLWVCNWENTKYGLCSVIFALIKKPA